jgi:hypothetical protein
MKTLTLTAAFVALLCFASKAQDIPLDTVSKQVSYASVVETPGTKDELYTKARAWFATAFKDSKSVIQMDDKESGKLIGKGIVLGNIRDALNITTLGTFKLNYTVYITVKDGKYRYEITEFNSQDLPGQNVWKAENHNIYDLAINPDNRKSNGKWKGKYATYVILTSKTGNELETSIKAAMSAPISASKDNF